MRFTHATFVVMTVLLSLAALCEGGGGGSPDAGCEEYDWYLDRDQDGHVVGDPVKSCSSPGPDYVSSRGSILSFIDNCPEDYNPYQTDSDGDRFGDACDTCPDLHNEAQCNYDHDKRGDACDACPTLPDDGADRDGDGIPDICDNCQDFSNPLQLTTDSTLLGCHAPAACTDLAEGSSTAWTATAAPPLGASVELTGPELASNGLSAVRMSSETSGDATLTYTAPVPIDTTSTRILTLAVRVWNTGVPFRAGAVSPRVVVRDVAGTAIAYTPAANLLPEDGTSWHIIDVPLDGGPGWSRSIGVIDWTRVGSVSFVMDVGSPFTLDLDRMSFIAAGTHCAADPRLSQRREICNGLDDDGDGLVDEGDVCRCDQVLENGHTYLSCHARVPWRLASRACAARGYTLAKIGDFIENNYWQPRAPSAWIGLSDFAAEGTWRWEDGSDLLWRPADPPFFNGGRSENCVQLVGNVPLNRWNDLSCNWSNEFLCERDGELLHPDMFGIAGHWFHMTDPHALQRFIDEYHRLGATGIRMGIDWVGFDKNIYGDLPADDTHCSGLSYDFSRFDAAVKPFQDAGIEVMGVFTTVPDYAVVNPPWVVDSVLKDDPKVIAGMRCAVRAMVSHYPKIKRWEFWNEPHWDGYWVTPRGDGKTNFRYWLEQFIAAAKAQATADGRAIKVGFNSPPTEEATDTFVTTTLTVKDRGPMPIADLDAIALHPYSSTKVTCDSVQPLRPGQPCPLNISLINSVHSLIDSIYGQSPSREIWITEYGFQEDGYAEQLETALRWMNQQPWLKVAYIHMLHDSDPGDKGSFGLLGGQFWKGTGLICQDVTDADRLPLWTRFQKLRREP